MIQETGEGAEVARYGAIATIACGEAEAAGARAGKSTAAPDRANPESRPAPGTVEFFFTDA
ncbi:MAG TPA: hypothetical protein VL977_05055 [Solirubrobacteraceae bacterium]|nr:hypothetical protein [Solirubrobacteraceae bacterium]